MTTSSTPDRGRALLMSTAAASFVLSAALAASPALAQNECGVQSGTTVTCPDNKSFSSITYTPTTDLTLVTQSNDTVAGPITVTGSGTANVTVTNNGTVNSATASAAGVYGTGVANVTINNAGSVTTSADNTPGIAAIAKGSGNAAVYSTGTVTTSGTGSSGVVAVNEGSGNTIVSVGDVSATGSGTAGVLAESFGSGTTTVTVNQGATVTGGLDGVALGATPSNTVATETLNNNGTINVGPNGSGAVYSFAGSGAIIVNNNAGGTINGPMTLNGGTPGATIGNTVNNAGTWNVSGTSIFGPTDSNGVAQTNNVLNNTGTIAVAPGVQNAGTTYFQGLTTFNNAGGVLDMSTGNSLNIENAEFEGGQNSTLKVNANSQSGLLTLASTQGGSTNVVLADIPATNPAMNLSGETLVTGPANSTLGPAAGSFTLGGPNSMDQRAGFVDYRLVFNNANQQQNTPSNYVLFGLPGPEVFEALSIPYALQDFWRHSADVLTQRQMSLRDSQVGQTPSRAEGWEFWAIPYGGEDYFKRPQEFQFGGFQFNSIGNHNDTIGLQVGADMLTHFGSGAGFWGLGLGGAGTGYWGFTGGIEQQTTHFQGDDANNLYSVGGNFGVYGGATWGGFYANAVGKVDFDDMNTNFFSAQFSPTNLYKAYGTRGEIGYRWPWSGFFVEPSARVNAIWIDGIDLNPAGALLHFNSGNASVDGEVGGRVGATVNFGKWLPGYVNPFPGTFNAYVGAWWADQWSGQNNLVFATSGGFEGPTAISLSQATMGNFIHMEYGLETADWYGGLKMFLKGENNFGGDSVGGWSALAGVRFTF